MKILIVQNFFTSLGGAEKSAYQEAQLLRKKNHEIYFYSTNKEPFFEQNYKFSSNFPQYIDYRTLSKIDSLKYLFRPLYNKEAEKKLGIFLKEIKPDIVHCHNIYYHLSPSVINICEKNKVPVVMTLRDCRLFCPSGTMMKGKDYCKNDLCLSGNPFYCLINKCKDNSYSKSAIVTSEYLFNRFRKFYDKISYFICLSEAIYDIAKKSGIKEERLVLINNFLNDEDIDNSSKYSDKDYFFYAGRLSGEKSVHTLLEAANMLPQAKIRIAGSGDEEENLKQLAKKMNLSNVEFLGFKNNSELEEEYKNCIAAILPCNWFENFPRGVMEAFNWSKPAIGSRIGGIPEMIDHGKNGFTFEPGNSCELKIYMEKLYNDRNLAAKLGGNGKNKVKKLYGADLHYQKLIDVYNLALNKKDNSCYYTK
ncbi:MAG: glycosyltransferase family 4 protein [Candidatus Gastranaerophilales bacterium]|nr:glycosyltransferase family 4 protein [Candidatus Gastranaerophilales bacterium]